MNIWRLMGWDTFSGHWYDLDGEYRDEYAAREAAKERLEQLEEIQPTSSSGGQDHYGIQDRVYIVRPDGTNYRFF